MRIATLSLIIIISFLIYAAESQQAIEPALNPEFIEYFSKDKDASIQGINGNEIPSGLIPKPYPVNNTFHRKEAVNKSRILAPEVYDLRNVSGSSYVTSVKNQGSCGSCWAFATFGAIESSNLVAGLGTYNYSEQNLKNCHGFYWGHCSGGNDEISTSYLSKNKGPLYETDNTYSTTSSTCVTSISPKAYVIEAWSLPNRYSSGYASALKEHILSYGAFYTTMRWESSAYNSTTKCFRYTGTSAANHAVVCVGWDDTKDMSSVGATTRGAWIIKNSWGTSWGEGGYFYISYEDRRIHEWPTAWPTQIDYKQNAKLYYYDEFGGVSKAGFGSNTAYGLIKFIGAADQQITRLGTYITSPSCSVTVEIYDDFDGTALSNLRGSITRTFTYPGYHTFELGSPVNIYNGDDFYLKIKYYTPGYNYPMPIERVINNYCTPAIESGKCWISSNGTSWTAIGTGKSNVWDLCCRAYALQVEAPTLVSPVNNSDSVEITPTLKWTGRNSKSKYKLQLSRNSNFSSPCVNQNNLDRCEYSVPQNTLNYGEEYYWRVCAVDDGACSDWTTGQFMIVVVHDPPVLVSPDDEATGINLTPTLEWEEVTTAEYYDLQIATDMDFSSPIVDETGITDLAYLVAESILDYSTTYYWAVRAAGNGMIESDWSIRGFTTMSESLSPPTLISPEDGASDVTVTPELDWSDVAGATTYDLEVSQQSDFSTLDHSQTGLTSSIYEIPSDVFDNGITYHWRVKAKNSSSESDWSGRSFTTASSSTISPPELVSPTNSSTNIEMPPFLNWSNVDGADSYRIQIFTNEATPELVLDESGLTESEYQVSVGVLLYNTYYQWRVNVTVGGQTSEWTTKWLFKTEAIGTATLLSPSSGARNVSVTPTFDWADYSNADSYMIQVSSSYDFTELVVNESGLTESEFVVPGDILLYGEHYYWRVKVIIGSQSGNWSRARRFKTMYIPKPELVSPTNWTTNVSLTPELDWSDVDDGDSYNLQISTASDFVDLVLDEANISESMFSVQSGTLSQDTRYFWRVNVNIGSQTGDWSRSWRFFTRKIGVPRLLSPANRSDGISITPTLDWSDVNLAESYNLQISKDNSFSDLVLDLNDVTESSYDVPSGTLLYNTRYFWRASTNEGGRSGNWSNDYKFKTMSIESPSLISPSNNARNVSLTPTLDWNDLSYAERYNLQISTSSNFSNILYAANDLTSSNHTVPSGKLSYNKTYYWRVNAEVGSQTGAWSTKFKFSTRRPKQPEIDIDNPGEFSDYSVNIYPNPAEDRIWVQCQLDEEKMVTINIINLLGEEILSYNLKTIIVNEEILLIGLPQGIYYILVKAGDMQEVRQIIKQ